MTRSAPFRRCLWLLVLLAQLLATVSVAQLAPTGLGDPAASHAAALDDHDHGPGAADLGDDCAGQCLDCCVHGACALTDPLPLTLPPASTASNAQQDAHRDFVTLLDPRPPRSLRQAG